MLESRRTLWLLWVVKKLCIVLRADHHTCTKSTYHTILLRVLRRIVCMLEEFESNLYHCLSFTYIANRIPKAFTIWTLRVLVHPFQELRSWTHKLELISGYWHNIEYMCVRVQKITHILCCMSIILTCGSIFGSPDPSHSEIKNKLVFNY